SVSRSTIEGDSTASIHLVYRKCAKNPYATISSVPDFDSSVPALIDHTLLKPEATAADIRKVCAEARHYGFASVCVNPYCVRWCAGQRTGPTRKVCSVVGFPLGASATQIKVAETAAAIRDGAQEIDMV